MGRTASLTASVWPCKRTVSGRRSRWAIYGFQGINDSVRFVSNMGDFLGLYDNKILYMGFEFEEGAAAPGMGQGG